MHHGCDLAGHDGAVVHIALYGAAQRAHVHALELVAVLREVALELFHRASELVLEAAHRMARPAAGNDRVGILRGENLLLVRVGHGALVHREEARAHLHALGAECERGGDAAAVGDSACADDGDRHRVSHRRQERHRGEFPHMATRFGALRHDGVGAEALHADREGGRCDDGDDLDARSLPHLHIVRRAAGTRGDHVDLQVDEQLRELGSIGVHEHHVRAKRLRCDLARGFHLVAHPIERRAAAGDDAKAARFADRARKARVRDARHGTLNDRHLNAQEFSNTSFHVQKSFPKLGISQLEAAWMRQFDSLRQQFMVNLSPFECKRHATPSREERPAWPQRPTCFHTC